MLAVTPGECQRADPVNGSQLAENVEPGRETRPVPVTPDLRCRPKGAQAGTDSTWWLHTRHAAGSRTATRERIHCDRGEKHETGCDELVLHRESQKVQAVVDSTDGQATEKTVNCTGRGRP